MKTIKKITLLETIELVKKNFNSAVKSMYRVGGAINSLVASETAIKGSAIEDQAKSVLINSVLAGADIESSGTTVRRYCAIARVLTETEYLAHQNLGAKPLALLAVSSKFDSLEAKKVAIEDLQAIKNEDGLPSISNYEKAFTGELPDLKKAVQAVRDAASSNGKKKTGPSGDSLTIQLDRSKKNEELATVKANTATDNVAKATEKLAAAKEHFSTLRSAVESSVSDKLTFVDFLDLVIAGDCTKKQMAEFASELRTEYTSVPSTYIESVDLDPVETATETATETASA